MFMFLAKSKRLKRLKKICIANEKIQAWHIEFFIEQWFFFFLIMENKGVSLCPPAPASKRQDYQLVRKLKAWITNELYKRKKQNQYICRKYESLLLMKDIKIKAILMYFFSL